MVKRGGVMSWPRFRLTIRAATDTRTTTGNSNMRPLFTRRHYRKLALIMRLSKPVRRPTDSPHRTATKLSTWKLVRDAMLLILAEDNQRFDPDYFRNASEGAAGYE